MSNGFEPPTFDAQEIAFFDARDRRRPIEPGQYLYHEGDPAYDFYILLSGVVDIVVGADTDEERFIIRHGPGRFLGELNLLSGMRVFVSARVVEPGEVLVVPVGELRRVLSTQPALSDKILSTFMARRADLLTDAAIGIRVVGTRLSAEAVQLREFLARTRVPYQWLDPDTDPEVDGILREFDIEPSALPVVISRGSVLRRPSPGVLAEDLGLTIGRLPDRCFDLIIVGGGPAGLAAAVYGASEGLHTLGVEMTAPGGQAGTSSRIENYFGFPTGISGGDLTQRGVVQAEKFGAVLSVPCVARGLREESGHLVTELSDGTAVVGRAVIAASGARYRHLEVEGLEQFENRGLYYAATDLEARLCAGGPVVVVGGGNSAGQAAVYLADSGSPVTVVIRGPDLNAKMSRYLVDRLVNHARIEIRADTEVVALQGDGSLQGVVLSGTGGEEKVATAGLFSFIGAEPQSEWLSGLAALDSRGFVLTDRALRDDDLDERWRAMGRRPLPFETSCPGLFAVGDLRSGSTKRVAAAVGEGSSAVRSVHEHLAFAQR